MYKSKLLKRFRKENTNSVFTPIEKSTPIRPSEMGHEAAPNFPYRQAIGSFLYMVSCTRPDLACAIWRLSQYLAKPLQQHWTAVRRLFRYLYPTRELSIRYYRQWGIEIVGCSYLNYAGCTISRKPSGNFFFLDNGAISWRSKRKCTVATSSRKAKYIATCAATKEVNWLSRQLADFWQISRPSPITVLIDNNGAKD